MYLHQISALYFKKFNFGYQELKAIAKITAKIQRLLKAYIVKSQTNMPKEQYDKMSLKIKAIYCVSRLQTSPK